MRPIVTAHPIHWALPMGALVALVLWTFFLLLSPVIQFENAVTPRGSSSARGTEGFSRFPAACVAEGVPVETADVSLADHAVVCIEPGTPLPEPAASRLLAAVQAGRADLVVLGTQDLAQAHPQFPDAPATIESRGAIEVLPGLPGAPSRLVHTDAPVRVFRKLPSDATVLAQDSEGRPFAYAQPVGFGRVLCVAEATPFLNGQIADRDHARFLLGLCAHRSALVFEDRTLPQESPEAGSRAPGSLLTGTWPGRFLLTCVLCGLVACAFVFRNNRSPRARPASAPTLRTGLVEHLEAPYRRESLVAVLYAALETAVERASGQRPATPDVLAGGLSRLTGHEASEILQVLTPASATSFKPVERLERMAQLLHALPPQAHHGHQKAPRS